MIRTPDQRLRVFVSSTLEELAEERAAAREAIENLRLTPVLFELGARPHPPRQIYRAYLEQSDVFVGIYGERYGWVAPEMEISGLEDEYLLARPKPRLLYVKLPAERREARLRALIEQIESAGDVSYRTFRTAAELRALIEDDLAVVLSERFLGDERRLRVSVPAPVDRFVGRTQELEALLGLLADPATRLVTVTGPGGVGKTRLALEAARSQHGFRAGAHFVSLDSIADPELVVETVVGSLGLPATGAPSQLDALIDGLCDRNLLLVLDNFEHVVPAAGDLGLLLEGCSQLTALVTSRTLLRLKGEREFPVQPLVVPADDGLEGSEAIALFIERASAANTEFELEDENRGAVAEVCRRLEGLPLALELAAAQVRLLPPAAILERVENRLELAAVGTAYPERQQTMRAALDWSFELLGEAERTVFARAGVFRGGWTLEAFTEVCAASLGLDSLQALGSLVDSSLARPVAGSGGPRFVMLETIREYAGEKLDQLGGAETIGWQHASFYLELVTTAGAGLRAAGHTPWLTRLDDDEDNVRAALRWSLDHGEGERVADAAWALMPYWTIREHFAEGRRLTAELKASTDVPPSARAKALAVDGVLAFWASDYEGAVPPLTEALTVFRAAGDDGGAALVQVPLGVLGGMRGATDTALRQLEDSRRVFERLGDEWGLALTGIGLGFVLNAARAHAPIEFFEDLVTEAARLGREFETIALGTLGYRRAIRGERREAKETLSRALRGAMEFKAPVGVRWYLELIADLAADEGDDGLAVRLSAAAESVFDLSDAAESAFVGNRVERLPALRERLGEEEFERQWTAGRSLGEGEACAEALAWAGGRREV